MSSLAICVPTYKRPLLLKLLIEDLMRQTVHPTSLIIVDGDQASGEVKAMLEALSYPEGWRVLYVPSNHGNLSYQRYLGWRVAALNGHDMLLYFDDDLRIPQPDAVSRIIAPLHERDSQVVGVTAGIIMGEETNRSDTRVLRERGKKKTGMERWLVNQFGSARHVAPAGLTAMGDRRPPLPSTDDYVQTEWLAGGVMAYRMDAMSQATFSDDLFALDHIRCGLGEDTFLSRRVAAGRKLCLAQCVTVEHPCADTPKSYPYQARRLAFAVAYSRRFQHDHYRVYDAPTRQDRLALYRSYLGNIMLNWTRAITSLRRDRLAYAWGFTTGALKGILVKPTARNLTPNIDWWSDADAAVARCQTIR
jgi:GT2 family glycosyltransferase